MNRENLKKELTRARRLHNQVVNNGPSWKHGSLEYTNWTIEVLGLIRRVYGEKSSWEDNFTRYQKFIFYRASDLQLKFHENLKTQMTGFMKGLIKEISTKVDLDSQNEIARKRPKVFISHGGDTPEVTKTELYLWRHGYKPVIVEIMPKGGMSPNKLVDFYLKSCDFAVILAQQKGASIQDDKLIPRGNIIDELARIRLVLGNKFIVLMEDKVSLNTNQNDFVYEKFSSSNFETTYEAIERELEKHFLYGNLD